MTEHDRSNDTGGNRGRAESTAGGGTRVESSRRTFLRAAGVGALAAGTGVSLISSAAADPGDAFVQTSGTDFVVDGHPIHFNGTNNFWLMDTYYGTPSVHDSAFSVYDQLGLNFVRTWGFKDGTSDAGPMLQPEPRTYNEEAFQRFDSLVAKAGEYGIKLVLPLVNNWEEYGGKSQYVSWVDSASSADEFYTNSECRAIFKDYIEYVLTRENTITGVQYRDDPAIAIWELGNEPRAGNLSNGVQAMTDWVSDVSAHIRNLAPNQLVSTGMEGFYDGSDHGSGYGYNGADGTDYVAHHQIDTIDVCSYHIYPDAWGKTPEWATDWIAQHQGDATDVIGKPAYCGEFGLSADSYSMAQRNSYYRSYYDAFDQHDADGVAIWQIVGGSSAELSDSRGTAHDIYTDDSETLSIVQDYGATVRSKSGITFEPNGPAAPTGLSMVGRDNLSIDLAWDATVGWGPGADHYEVVVNGETRETVSPDLTATTITGLSESVDYQIAVVAVDVNGTRSSQSNTITVSTLPENASTKTDDCNDTSVLASTSDTGSLGTDTTNASYFNRPDGTTDGARLTRSALEDVALEYTIDGQLLDVAVEFHVNSQQGGDVEYYASSDGGSTWTSIDMVRTVFSGPGSGGWSNELHTHSGFASGVDRIRMVLTGGGAAWSGQVGNVSLTYTDGSTVTPTPTPGDGSADLDGDGLYEDLNGNGRLDNDDVVTYFEQMNGDQIQNNVSRYDFNGNGRIDFDDLVTLFESL